MFNWFKKHKSPSPLGRDVNRVEFIRLAMESGYSFEKANTLADESKNDLVGYVKIGKEKIRVIN
ncbi:MAG: hypothetical protein KBC48_02940 [Candidatus Pacebacteria bacterium]|nr:hypothetical protein [Candidatus Paceibacterota bacterium]